MDITKISALFWDYENVPLRNKDYKKFLQAIVSLINTFEFEFIRVYARKETLTPKDRKLLIGRGFNKIKHFKWVKLNDPNAVDFSMMKSCVDVLKRNSHLTQVVLITGDGDFLWLVKQLPKHYIVVICQQKNLNKQLINSVNRAYSVEAIITTPKRWFYY